MLTSGTSQGNSEVTLTLALEARNAKGEQRLGKAYELLSIRLGHDIVVNGRIETREPTQPVDEKRVFQKPDVQNQIRVYRSPVLEPETEETAAHPRQAFCSRTEQRQDLRPKIVNAELRGIQDDAGTLPQGTQ